MVKQYEKFAIQKFSRSKGVKEYIKMAALAGKFRQCFKISKENINWYPGHMESSFKHMQAILRQIDCVVEVHDSRIPFSGRNPKFFYSFAASKPHILVLNKKDLIDKLSYSAIKEKCLEDNCPNVIFTNCLDLDCRGLHKIIPLALSLIQKNGLIARMTHGYKMMIIGVPNVGKSSLINALRHISFGRGRATAVGSSAGVTRNVQYKIKVSTEPPMYLIDTPGILAPNIKDIECGMKLALCSCLNDSVVGVPAIADFLLYWMNKTENFYYVDHFGLQQPVDEIFPLLIKIAVDNNKMKRIRNIVNNSIEKIPDVHAAAECMVSLFRKGVFGDLDLDKDYLCQQG